MNESWSESVLQILYRKQNGCLNDQMFHIWLEGGVQTEATLVLLVCLTPPALLDISESYEVMSQLFLEYISKVLLYLFYILRRISFEFLSLCCFVELENSGTAVIVCLSPVNQMAGQRCRSVLLAVVLYVSIQAEHASAWPTCFFSPQAFKIINTFFLNIVQLNYVGEKCL